jgi:multicomponent Na+:H+ antiporter subunit F
MNLVLLGACCFLLFGAFLVLYRALTGPTVFDRILAVNAIGTKAVLLVAILGFFGDPSFFLDTSMVYALINFAATIAILRYVHYRRLG